MSDHHRVSPEGRTLGQLTSLMAASGMRRMAGEGSANLGLPTVRDEMCATCACRPDTVPNGCLQTQMDLLKAVVQGDKFLCHAPKDGRMCAGAVAVRAAHVADPIPPPLVAMLKEWEYSPPGDAQEAG